MNQDHNERLLLKISGEFLGGDQGFGYDIACLDQLAEDIISVVELGYQIALVIGGGNIVRGKQLTAINQTAADNVGMLGTLQNAIVVSELLSEKGQNTVVFSAFQVDKIARYYTYQAVTKALKQGRICFLAGGTGNPHFTTDTAAVLRAIELNCDLVLKGTNVAGVYSADPKKYPSAQFIKNVTYDVAIAHHLNVMDMTAFSLAKDYKVPIKVFSIHEKGNLLKAVTSSEIGSLVS